MAHDHVIIDNDGVSSTHSIDKRVDILQCDSRSTVRVAHGRRDVIVEENRTPILTLGGQGLAGKDGDKHYQYDQDVPSDTWDITHNLNKYPSVSVVDSAGTSVEGCVTHMNRNRAIIVFNAAFSGTVYFN